MTSNGFLYNLNSDQLKHVYYSWNHSLLNRGTNYLLTP